MNLVPPTTFSDSSNSLYKSILKRSPSLLNLQATSNANNPITANETITITSKHKLMRPKMASTPNRSLVQHPSSPQQTSPSSQFSVYFYATSPQFPSPSQVTPLRAQPRTQPHPHLTKNEEAPVPLLHHETGLPITSTPQTSPPRSPSEKRLPELPLYILSQFKDELCTEQLQKTLERLQDANSRGLRETGTRNTVDEIATAGDAGIIDASGTENGPDLNGVHGVQSAEHENITDMGGVVVKPEPELVSFVGNQETVFDADKDAFRQEGIPHYEQRSGCTVDMQTSKEECSHIYETVKEEPVLARWGDFVAPAQMSLTRERDSDIAEEGRVTARRMTERVEPKEGSRAIPIESDAPPAVSKGEGRGQPRRKGKKRRRGEVEIRYWLRSQKPPSSSKRSRRTWYWLRP